MQDKRKNNGGAREGAGRPSIPEDRKRVSKTISVSAENARRLDALRAKKVDVGLRIEQAIEDLAKEKGI